MKKEKKKKRFQKLKLLNPKNLSAEVHVYGYNFSWKAHMLVVLCTLLGICSIGVLFKLESTYFIITLLAACVMLPVLVLETYKRMYEQKRFADAVTYAEQILYSFQKNGKVIFALRETREIYEDGQMKQAIEDAIVHLEIGCAETEKGVLREALEMIEKQYACVKIHMVHELLISSEEFGGDVSNSILLVLNDIELWKRRGYKLQADKKTSHTDNIISIVVATILCAAALYVLDAMGKMFPNVENFSIFGVGVIQISSFVFILFLMFVLAKSIRSLTENWLNNEALMDADYILSSYDTVMNYDEKKEKKKSILFTLPFAVGAAAAFYFENVWIAVICILLVAFMLMQHRVGYSMAKKDVNRELYIALPQWLMEIALLLQGNNVQVSIAKSRVEAPAVLQKELLLLTERLQQEPDKLSSYTDFCKDFDVSEVQSCMKMLHAISESGTGNADIQINNLIQRVNEMQDMADNIRNESIAFRMKMLFSYPVLAATVKLLIDLTFRYVLYVAASWKYGRYVGMKHIIGAFGTLVVLMMNIFICISVSNASSAAAEAKEFKAAVVAEIENSNFNPNVINACIAQAEDAGYSLQVTDCTYDRNNQIQTAEVILTYSYSLPLFGIEETVTTRGIAR